MRRKYATLSLNDLSALLDASDEAMDAILYSRRNGGKYKSVERMLRKIHEYVALRDRLIGARS